MALTYATGMTVDSTAQAITNYGAIGFVGGAVDHGPVTLPGGGGIMGTNCISLADTAYAAGDNNALLYDYFTANASTALNLTTAGNEVLAVWWLVPNLWQMQTLANGGIYVIASSSTDTGATTPTAYRRWYVNGADVAKDTASGLWYLAMIDTRKTASVADVGAFSLSAVRRIGIGCIFATGTVPGGPPPENLAIGGVMHGRPIYQVIGDGSTVASFADIINHSTVTQKNGLIEDKGGGIYRAACGFRFGNSTQGATTTFTDSTGKVFEFARKTYYNAGEVDALNYVDYYLLDAQGAASFKTSVTLGSVVGSGDARQGVNGGSFLTGDQTNITWKADFSATANLTAVNLYGVRYVGAKGGVKFDDGTKTTVITNAWQRSGEVDCGTTSNGANLLNSTIVDPAGGTAQNYGLRLPSVHNIKNMSFITSGTPATQRMLNLPTSGTYTVTMDNLQFFGAYSGTLSHGDLSSATLTTATGAALNGANPNATNFSKTGNASSSIVVNNSKAVKVTVLDVLGAPVPNCRVAIYKSGNVIAGQELVNALSDASGVVSTTFNYTVDQAIIVRLRENTPGAPRYFFIEAIGTITTAGYNATFTLTADPIAT